jgi:hypothetical protein
MSGDLLDMQVLGPLCVATPAVLSGFEPGGHVHHLRDPYLPMLHRLDAELRPFYERIIARLEARHADVRREVEKLGLAPRTDDDYDYLLRPAPRAEISKEWHLLARNLSLSADTVAGPHATRPWPYEDDALSEAELAKINSVVGERLGTIQGFFDATHNLSVFDELRALLEQGEVPLDDRLEVKVRGSARRGSWADLERLAMRPTGGMLRGDLVVVGAGWFAERGDQGWHIIEMPAPSVEAADPEREWLRPPEG